MKRNLVTVFMAITSIILGFGCTSPVPKNNLSTEQQAEYLERGKNITMSSFKALSAELLSAIETGGIEKAVNYCNLKAIPLTDSLSGHYKAEIHRISDKYRNPDNRPGELDMKVISAYRQQMDKGQELQAHLEVTGDTVYYYAPILIQNPLCLQCHGEPGNTMQPENELLIKAKYPADKATGYKLGELRGVWKIMFND
jgi:hypothetical protein